MEEVIVDTIEAGGMRRLRVVRDAPLELEGLLPELKIWEDEALGLHYAEALYPYRGAVEVHFEGLPKRFRRLVCWALQGDRVSKGMQEGAMRFEELFGRRPEYAFIERLPTGAESGVEVDGVMLMEAEWAMPGCLYLGG